MYLACPACTSRFRVNPAAIGDGRDVRCSKCGNEWFVMQSDILDEKGMNIAPPPAAQPESIPQQQEEAVVYERAQPVHKEYGSDVGMPLGDEFPIPQESQPREVMPAENMSAPPMQDDWEADLAVVPEKEIDFEALDAALTQKTKAMMAVPVRTERGPKMMLLAMACGVLLLLNVTTAIVFFRVPLLRTIPALSGLYSVIGYQDKSGLSFADLRLTRYGTKERPRFDISGVVVNTSDHTITEPDVRIAMITKKGEVLREWPLNGGDKAVPQDRPLNFSTQDQFLKTMRAAEAETLVLHLGSPLELSLSD
ncbi:MAG: zinc-ribbon domain-containing protein [Rickettsiales bacterium]|nr:zinc-ribbon domain-containing protein [Rickettsiales bacterium]